MPDGGYFIQRTRDRYLIFDCGPLGDGGHGHYDALSFEAWTGDRPLVMDPGRYTYAERPNCATGSAAPRRTTRSPSTGRTRRRTRVVVRRCRARRPPSSATRAPTTWTSSRARSTSPCYEAVHRRRVILVRGAYWLVEDTLTGERSHRYDLYWHLPPDAQDLTHTLGGARRRARPDDRDPRRALGRPRGRLDQPRVRRQARRAGRPRDRGRRPRALRHPARPARAGRPRAHLRRDGDALLVGDDRIVLP